MFGKIAAILASLNLLRTFGWGRILYSLVTYAILITLSFALEIKYVITMWIAFFAFDYATIVIYNKYYPKDKQNDDNSCKPKKKIKARTK